MLITGWIFCFQVDVLITGRGLAAYKLGAYKRNFTVRNSVFSMILVEK